MKFDCAIFDLDGTLTDSQHLWFQTWLDILHDRGVEAQMSDLAFMTQMELPESAYAISHSFPTGLTQQQAIDLAVARMTRHYAETVPLKPGARELLLELRRRGIVCCLATASVEERFMPMLRRLQLVELLDHIVTTHQVGKNKHHPDIFLEAARRAGTDPARTVVLEDTLYCLKTAKKAGFLTLGVEEPASEGTPEEMTALCTWFAPDPAHLPESFWQD